MTPHDAYLETQVMTATPQRLRLMLIEGAIRLARQTAEHWRAERNEEALESLIRCRAIISELIAGVKADQSPLARRVVSVYLFLFTTLTEAQLTRDAAKLESAIRVLSEDRQTWSQVCQQLAESPANAAAGNDDTERAPARIPNEALDADARPRLSLDA